MVSETPMSTESRTPAKALPVGFGPTLQLRTAALAVFDSALALQDWLSEEFVTGLIAYAADCR